MDDRLRGLSRLGPCLGALTPRGSLELGFRVASTAHNVARWPYPALPLAAMPVMDEVMDARSGQMAGRSSVALSLGDEGPLTRARTIARLSRTGRTSFRGGATLVSSAPFPSKSAFVSLFPHGVTSHRKNCGFLFFFCSFFFVY